MDQGMVKKKKSASLGKYMKARGGSFKAFIVCRKPLRQQPRREKDDKKKKKSKAEGCAKAAAVPTTPSAEG